jgi:flagellar biosynthesis anti-sigma factor FlgM
MRIDLRTEFTSTDAVQRLDNKTVRKDEDGPSVTSSDSASVRFAGLEQSATAVPEIRAHRVEELRQAIAAGTYSVSDEALAGAMLKDHLVE